jgi:hypothetical protein
LGLHCVRQYIVGKELSSKRDVQNLLELFAADWAVLLISVDTICLVELALAVNFNTLRWMFQFGPPTLVSTKFLLENVSMQVS